VPSSIPVFESLPCETIAMPSRRGSTARLLPESVSETRVFLVITGDHSGSSGSRSLLFYAPLKIYHTRSCSFAFGIAPSYPDRVKSLNLDTPQDASRIDLESHRVTAVVLRTRTAWIESNLTSDEHAEENENHQWIILAANIFPENKFSLKLRVTKIVSRPEISINHPSAI